MSTETPFASWLKQRRKALGLTQQELAERIECSLALLVKLEAGGRRPSGQIALLLAETLGVPADEQQAFLEFARAGGRAESGVPGAGAGSPAPWRARPAPALPLPAPPTSFVDRPAVVAAAGEVLHSPGTRLLTFTGPPGSGKTRLALELARRAASAFPDGIHFAGLSAVPDPALVPAAIAQTLGLAVSPPALLDRVQAHLRDKRLLLVLDGCDPVLEGLPVVAALLGAAPWLKVLATSRTALHVYGEHTFPVPPLTTPADPRRYPARAERLLEYEAVRLFVERARAVQPEFRLTDANTAAVVAICLRLEAQPLAIEQAAAHSARLTPPQILARLETGLEVPAAGL
jgi:transcriptional regulator with XRE-family HTH domain